MPSFDIVIECDLQEVDNAINQARKEVAQRFDFRGSKSTIEWDKKGEIVLLSDDDYKLVALMDVLHGKLIRRGISPKNLSTSEPEPASDSMVRQKITMQIGLPKEVAKAIVKEIKNTKIKVQAQMQDEQVRVTGKKRDDLQAAMQAVKESKQDFEFQFVNFRD